MKLFDSKLLILFHLHLALILWYPQPLNSMWCRYGFIEVEKSTLFGGWGGGGMWEEEGNFAGNCVDAFVAHLCICPDKLLPFLMGFRDIECWPHLAFSPSASLRVKVNHTCKQVIVCWGLCLMPLFFGSPGWSKVLWKDIPCPSCCSTDWKQARSNGYEQCHGYYRTTRRIWTSRTVLSTTAVIVFIIWLAPWVARWTKFCAVIGLGLPAVSQKKVVFFSVQKPFIDQVCLVRMARYMFWPARSFFCVFIDRDGVELSSPVTLTSCLVNNPYMLFVTE